MEIQPYCLALLVSSSEPGHVVNLCVRIVTRSPCWSTASVNRTSTGNLVSVAKWEGKEREEAWPVDRGIVFGRKN